MRERTFQGVLDYVDCKLAIKGGSQVYLHLFDLVEKELNDVEVVCRIINNKDLKAWHA